MMLEVCKRNCVQIEWVVTIEKAERPENIRTAYYFISVI